MLRGGYFHATAIGLGALHQMPRHVIDTDMPLRVLHDDVAILCFDGLSFVGFHVVDSCASVLLQVPEVSPDDIFFIRRQRAEGYGNFYVHILRVREFFACRWHCC